MARRCAFTSLMKLGYKHAKYLTGLRVTDVLKPMRGYWEDQGYSWFAGI